MPKGTMVGVALGAVVPKVVGASDATTPDASAPGADLGKGTEPGSGSSGEKTLLGTPALGVPLAKPMALSSLKGTMVGVAVPGIAPAISQASAPAAPSPGAKGGRTVVGMAIPESVAALGHATTAEPEFSAGPSSPSGTASPSQGRAMGKTMVGVALPGIAPTPGGAEASNDSSSKAKVPHARTVLGVAVPGIAPTRDATHDPKGAEASSDPAGSNLGSAVLDSLALGSPGIGADESLSGADVAGLPKRSSSRRRGGGVPLPKAIALVGVVSLLFGGSLVFLWKGAPPLVGQARVDGEGKELLHLTCSKCEDGTLATLDGVSVTFKWGGDKGAEADLPLAKPLIIGNNPLSIALDRPGLGRDEIVPITVSVPYRLRPRLDSLGANSGQGPVAIEVELQEGAKLTLGGEAVAVDARGHGMKDVALGAENEGPTGESKVIDKGVDYVFRGPDSSEDRGAVRIKVTILPLVIDSPPLQWVTEGRSVWIAGRTAKGAAVFVGKDRATLQGDGSFTHKVDLPKGSEQSLVVRVQSEGFVPRIARMAVKQVDSLRAEGKVFEAKASEASGLLGNDAVTADLPGAVGKAMVVEGEVLQETIQGLQSILLIDNRRGCAKGPCVVRVVTVKDDRFQKGSVWKAFGYVSKAFPTNSGTMVPEVEAAFLTPR